MPVWGKSCCFMSERLSPVFTLACISAGVSGTLFKDIFLGRQAQTASIVKLLKEITPRGWSYVHQRRDVMYAV